MRACIGTSECVRLRLISTSSGIVGYWCVVGLIVLKRRWEAGGEVWLEVKGVRGV